MDFMLMSILVLVILLPFGTAQQPISGQTGSRGILTYEHPSSDFSLQYPSNWTKVNYTGQENIVAFVPPQEKSLSQLLIITQNLGSQNKSLLTYVEEQIDHLDYNLLDFNLVELDVTTITGHPSYKIVYTFKIPYLPGEYKSIEIWMIESNKLYIIRYSSDQELYRHQILTVGDIIDSFRISR
jgi:hypothetical protein